MKRYAILAVLLMAVIALVSGLSMTTQPRTAQAQSVTDLVPPTMSNPTYLTAVPWTMNLDENTDYIITIPEEGVEGMAINGGRNIIIQGGVIDIPHQGSNPSITSRRGMQIRDNYGTVHIEGVLFTGEDMSEGLQLDTPYSTVQLENVLMDDIHARDQDGFTDNHPDCIQIYGNVRHLEVLNYTCYSDYQGIFMSNDQSGAHGSVNLTNVNIRANGEYGRYGIWVSDEDEGPYHYDNVWHETSEYKMNYHGSHWNGWNKSTYPESNRTEGIESSTGLWYHEWSATTNITGRVYEGVPPGGDFVPVEYVGNNYNPSYFENLPDPTPTDPPTPTPTPTETPETPTPTPTDPGTTPTPVVTEEPVQEPVETSKRCAQFFHLDVNVEICTW